MGVINSRFFSGKKNILSVILIKARNEICATKEGRKYLNQKKKKQILIFVKTKRWSKKWSRWGRSAFE